MSSRRMALRGFGRPARREFGRVEKAVDVDQGHRRGRRNAQLAAAESHDARARLLDKIVPAGIA